MIQDMTLEQALLSGIGAVTSALCVAFKIIWDRSVACEQWRAEKEPIITMMAEKMGLAKGTLAIIDECPTPGCPYAGKLSAGSTFSLTEEERARLHNTKLKRP
jgi:hypothetical protein